MNLRGVRESGKAFAVPVYAFMLAIIGMGIYGIIQHFASTFAPAESAALTLKPEEGQGLTGLAAAFLLLRAFSSGCAALTGVEAISNGVPAFQQTQERQRRGDPAAHGRAVGHHARVDHRAQPVDRDQDRRQPCHPAATGDGQPVGDSYVQQTVIGQLSEAVFANFHLGVVFVSIVTGLILVLAANTAFNGFPVLGSILARDGYLPRQMHTRGDRLAFSNGILILAGAAIVLVIVFKAEVTALIQLYIVGVFVSFTTSQIGMVRHWTRNLRARARRQGAARMQRSRVINGDRRRDVRDRARRRAPHEVPGRCEATPSSRWSSSSCSCSASRSTTTACATSSPSTGTSSVRCCRATSTPSSASPRCTSRRCAPSSYARASRPSYLEAVTVDVDPDETQTLLDEWDQHDDPGAAQGADARPTGRSPSRSSTTSARSAAATRATSSRSTCPSTSSGSGGSRCCTTRARCASRPACSSRRASWSSACRGSSQSSEGAERDWIDEPPISGSVRGGAL